MADVLVTGATGFLGSHLVRQLVSAGERVRVLVRDPDRLALLGDTGNSVETVRGEITDPSDMDAAVEGVDAVYHCAAFVGFGGGKEREALMRVNVGGTRVLVNSALRAGVRRVVHTSSIAALGRPENPSGCLDESTEWTESKLNTAYAHSKHLAELEVHRGIAEGLDAVIVNPSVMFGPGGRAGENTTRIVEAVRFGRVPAIPGGATNVVDIADVAAGHRAAMERGKTGERYLLVGQNLTWDTILRTLANALGAEITDRRMGMRTALVLGALAEAGAWLTRRPPPLTRETARVTGHRTCYDNSRARQELGVSFRPFQETAQRIAEGLA